MPSLYKQYIEEISSNNIVENDKYFFEYKICNDCFVVENMFVLPEFRCSDVTLEMKSRIFKLARESGVRLLVGKVHLVNPHFENQVANYIKDGFDMCMSPDEKDTLIVHKEL